MKEEAKYTITGNAVVHVEASNILMSHTVQEQLKIPLVKGDDE